MENKEYKDFIALLKDRFENNSDRHPHVQWKMVEDRLNDQTEKLAALLAMELSGGEPDVVVLLDDSFELIYMDCCVESPAKRRSLCYDKEAWDSRKKFKPKNNAIDVALEMGTELLSEEDYRLLQKTGEYDCKTSSWLKTPNDVRSLGGALFGDFRFGRVFFYHNGAESYYAARGFRVKLVI